MNAGMPLKKSPLKFYILVFVLSVPFWLLGAIAQSLSERFPINLPVSSLMAVCPFVAALILANKEEKSYGIKKLVKTTFDYKKIKKKIWYVPIILLMPAVMLLSYGVMRFMARPLPEPNIQLFAIPILFALFFIGALCEEIGWMGYAIDPMQDRLGALAASLIMGAIWGIWHVVPYIQANHTLEWIVWQCIFSAAARVLIVWLAP